MNTGLRNLCLGALALVGSGVALVAGERPAHAGTRSCELKGTWISTTTGTSKSVSMIGALVRKKSGDATLTISGVSSDGSVTGFGSLNNETWQITFEYSNSPATAVSATEQATESAKDFQLKGTYTTHQRGAEPDDIGDFKLSGTCVKE